MTLNEMLLRLHRRLGISTGAQDELLTDLLADANALMLAYLNRAELPAALENAQCQLAVLLYNRLGMEGESAHSEGGVSRTAAAEFTFFMAIPVMAGASLIEVLGFIKDGIVPSSAEWGVLIIGIIVAFAVSLAVIRFLMDFVKKHSFESFGWYRIVLGIVVIIYFAINAA